MTTIETIKDEWKLDAKIDNIKIDAEVIRIPMLHSKYLEFMIEYRAKRAALVKKINSLKYLKRRYYRGECTLDELKENGWDQWQGLKPSGSELKDLYEQDPDLRELEEKYEYYSTGISVLEYIMKSIHSRGYELKSVIEFRKFMEGG
jgi:hypothetical protein